MSFCIAAIFTQNVWSLPLCCFSHVGSLSAESSFLAARGGVRVHRDTRTGCSLSTQRAWQQDGERPPLVWKERVVWWAGPPLDHQQPLHTPLSSHCQQDIPSWDTRRFSCLAQRALLSAAFIWNAKRGATGGSVSPRIKELLWRVPFSFPLFLSARACACVCRHIHKAGDHCAALQIYLCLLSLVSSSLL